MKGPTPKLQKKSKKVPGPKPLKFTPEQELFCCLYAGLGSKDLMANGVLSYLAAFDIDTPTSKIYFPAEKDAQGNIVEEACWDYSQAYRNAKSNASDLLRKPDIRVHIAKLFKEQFKDEFADNELLIAMGQREHWPAKVSAIHEFNELKGRITKKIKLTGVKSNLNDAQLSVIAEQVLKRAKK